LNAGNPDAAHISVRRSSAPVNFNGNNVSLDDETVGMVETNLRYQLTVEAVNSRFRLLSTAIKGQPQ
jgi:flagellar basal-body rod protein FlgB